MYSICNRKKTSLTAVYFIILYIIFYYIQIIIIIFLFLRKYILSELRSICDRFYGIDIFIHYIDISLNKNGKQKSYEINSTFNNFYFQKSTS